MAFFLWGHNRNEPHDLPTVLRCWVCFCEAPAGDFPVREPVRAPVVFVFR